MDRLNIFNPYKDKESTHEDVLTRNFLILIKNIPAVQVAFIELIRAKMPDVEIESAALGDLVLSEIYTQITSGNMLAGLQEQRMLSIVISDDEFTESHDVKESERKARYDGVMLCEPSWVFIIENKPYVGNIWEDQLNPNKDDANGNILINKPCCLSWREIINILNNVLASNTSCEVEKVLINDFLEYINNNYSWLNPYNRFELCKGQKELINKRCCEILQDCFPEKDLKYHRGWKHYIDTSFEDAVVKQIALEYENDGILLLMYAGDTMVAARELYKRIDLDKIKRCEDIIFEPNFHISYQGTGLVWFPTTKKNLLEYIDFWKKTEIHQIMHDEMFEYYSRLVKTEIIDANDDINSKIITKNYPRLNIIPGLFIGYKWSLEDAVKLDNEGEFAKDCKNKIMKIQDLYS